MNLYFIRHLPTQYNLNGFLQGSMDIDIAEVMSEADEAIQLVLQTLRTVNFDQVYCSKLIRTQQTASLYGYKKYLIDERINEFDFGIYEGKPRSVLLRDHEYEWLNDPFSLKLGESFNDFADRINSFILDIRKFKNVLVFSHGVVGRYLDAKYNRSQINTMNQFHLNNNQLLKVLI